MVREWKICDETLWKFLFGVFWIFAVIIDTKAHLRTTDISTVRKEKICQSTDIRNSVSMFSQLRGCQVVEGFVQIVLIDNADESDYFNISFPELTEITDYLLLYRVNGLRSLGKIFPNLAVIRGNTLFENYALVVFEMLHLQEIGLISLTDILRGAVLFAKNPTLCFVDTIDWDRIAYNAKGEHYISANKLQNECPMCPTNNHSCATSPIDGGSLCWNSQHCQKVCPAHCNGSCNSNGDCCHSSCLGGCHGPLNSDQCVACRYFNFQRRCVKKCPNNTYEYLNRRCILESECYTLPKPRKTDDIINRRNNPWKPFKGQCVLECPTGYLEIMETSNGLERYKCEACKGICKKECPGANVDSIAAAQELRGCTIIRGALEIQIRGGVNVVKELEENLNTIEEIDDYLKIVRSFPIVSLNFLRNLRVIHGNNLESSRSALIVLDNQNLVELWDWKTRKNEFRIDQGRLFFHFNPKLCLSEIDKLKRVAGLGDYTEHEVASSSNGDKVACNIKELNVTVYKKNSIAALIKWSQFEHYDSRTLLGYVVYSIEAPYQNVTMYDGRDACGGDGWQVDDVSASENPTKDGEKQQINHILTRLKPYTQYAFYVKTYTVATEKSGAQSRIQYFRTEPDRPSEPRGLTAFSNSSSELVIHWQPPAHPNGNLSYYIVTGHWEKDNEEFIEQRNYCLEPISLPPDTHKVTPKPKIEERNDLTDEKLTSCPCKRKIIDNKQREKEIQLEDHLQNQIYVKRFNSREKRDISSQVIEKRKSVLPNQKEETESHSFINGTGFTQNVTGNTTTLLMKKLRHFALYNIAVRACRKLEEGENSTKNNTCSEEAIVTARTLRLATADSIDSNHTSCEISNKSLGVVQLKWGEPKNPNSLIVAYEIEYKRSDIENPCVFDLDYSLQYKPTVECITRKHFIESGNTYYLRNLGPGNYSLRLRATSLSGNGYYTPYKYFVIEEEYTIASHLLYILIIIFLLALSFLIVAAFFLRRQYSQLPSRKLIASVNPEYVPTVYEPDDWEVSRSRVELLGEIGQGSFGMVYEGRLYSSEGSSEQLCAVKTVNVQAADRERIEFLNEASVMKAFNTHHVVKLLGVVSQGQPTLVIMELMKRGDLKSYLRSHRPDSGNSNVVPPSLKRILRMAAEIADGMAYLAAKKFVHRDLAARNCMVAEDLTVKIGDFGMTRDIYETEYYRKGSKGLLPVRWMAPESLKDGIFTSYSDAWSYGVVLYEMATLASQPYQGLSNDQVLRYVIDGGIMERPENCPDKLYSIMRLCWEHKPSSRPSFIELVTLLQNDVGIDFHEVSFYHSEEGIDYRSQITSEDTPLRVSREIEDFSLSEDEDFKEPRSSTSSKISNGSTNPNGYVPQQIVTTKC